MHRGQYVPSQIRLHRVLGVGKLLITVLLFADPALTSYTARSLIFLGRRELSQHSSGMGYSRLLHMVPCGLDGGHNLMAGIAVCDVHFPAGSAAV
jgi:hypothetical protein